MKLEVAQLLCRAAESFGYECTLREEYSGRGMYGRSTTGIVLKSLNHLTPLAAQAAMELAVDECNDAEYEFPFPSERFIEELKHLRTDNMGLDYIVY